MTSGGAGWYKARTSLKNPVSTYCKIWCWVNVSISVYLPSRPRPYWKGVAGDPSCVAINIATPRSLGQKVALYYEVLWYLGVDRKVAAELETRRGRQRRK